MSKNGFIHDKLDIKFLVLYIMARAAAPIDLPALAELALCDEGVDYFAFAEATAELVDSEHLSLADGQYAITEKGRKNGAICESSLPHSVRNKCNRSVSRLNGVIRRNAQVRAEVLPRDQGGYALRLTLDDESGNLMTLELFAASEGQAQRLGDQFRAYPEPIYNGILNTLLAEYEEGE